MGGNWLSIEEKNDMKKGSKVAIIGAGFVKIHISAKARRGKKLPTNASRQHPMSTPPG